LSDALVAFYHCWTPGKWEQPEAEFWAALGASGFDGSVHERFEDGPSEAATLNAVREHALVNDGAVLYAHTKGAADDSDFRVRWRHSMTNRVVVRWQEHLATLETGDVDAVGCHWLTPEAYPGMVNTPFFGGNFWMARCDYLRTLPPCPSEPRFEAELWVGRNNPRVIDLLPGWPDDNRWPELCE
jgi:hypothetical protein